MSSPSRLGILVVALATLSGCASVQRAMIGPMIDRIDLSQAESPSAKREATTIATTTASINTTAAAPQEDAVTRFVFRPGTSQLRVLSGDLFGSYPSQVTRYHGRLTRSRDGTTYRVLITFDMTSIRAASEDVTACLQHDFLEIDTYPEAKLEATLRSAGLVGASEEVLVDGNLELHGQRRRITFKGMLHREGSDYRFTSTFDLDRHAFDIRRRDMWDWAAKNDFRVTIDMLGTREKVTAEEVGN